MKLLPFDTSDVITDEQLDDVERRFARANELRARAFARGYIEGATAPELLEYYKERACSPIEP